MNVRVVIVTSAHPTFDKRVFQRHALLLQRAGHDVHLVAPGDEGVYERGGVVIHGFPRPRNKFARLARLPVIYRVARSLGGDVYHLHDPDLLTIGWRLRSSLGAAVVYDAHEDYSIERNVQGMSDRAGRLVSRILGRTEQTLARHLDAVVCPHRIRLAELKHPTKPALFLPNYPPGDVFGSVRTRSGRVRSVVYSGLLSVSRGAEMILEAAQRMPDVKFVLLAKFMVRAEHLWFVSELTRRKLSNVDFRGFVPVEELPAELTAAGVGIMPWLATPQHLRAAQPSKLYEYMACGLPVVAADLPITREIVAGNACGLLHVAGDVDSFVSNVYDILDDSATSAAMAARGFEAFRTRYNYDEAGQTLIEMYKELLRSKAKARHVGSSGRAV